MENYAELIFGARLRKDTPNEVVNVLRYLCGQIEYPHNLDGESSMIANDEVLFRGSSYYFGVVFCTPYMEYDNIAGSWIVSTRANLKNYNDEISRFLVWIKPYIARGSGERNMYAIVTNEDDSEPTIYYLSDKSGTTGDKSP